MTNLQPFECIQIRIPGKTRVKDSNKPAFCNTATEWMLNLEVLK